MFQCLYLLSVAFGLFPEKTDSMPSLMPRVPRLLMNQLFCGTVPASPNTKHLRELQLRQLGFFYPKPSLQLEISPRKQMVMLKKFRILNTLIFPLYTAYDVINYNMIPDKYKTLYKYSARSVKRLTSSVSNTHQNKKSCSHCSIQIEQVTGLSQKVII